MIIVFQDIAYELTPEQYERIQFFINSVENLESNDNGEEDDIYDDLYDHLEFNKYSYKVIGVVDNVFKF